jgi:hypothetical protein
MTFKSASGTVVWPTFVESYWRDAIGCSPFADESSATFVEPAVPAGFCSSLLQNGNAENGGSTGYSGWLGSGGTIGKTSPGLGGSPTAILLSKRLNTFNGPAQFLDSRCFISGAQYEVMVKYKLVYPTGAVFTCNPSVTDPTLAAICPRATLQIRSVKGQTVNATYLYPVASTMATTSTTGDSYMYGYFTFDDSMAATDSILFVVERVNKLFNIIVDDVSVSQSTTVCASTIINGDLEVGDNRAWFAFGNTSLEMISPGAEGSKYAIRTRGRSQFFASPAQNLMKDCIILGDKFTLSAKIKLEKNGMPYVCDAALRWGVNGTYNGTCPELSMRISKAGINTTVEDIGIITGVWNASSWNTLSGAGAWRDVHLAADTLTLVLTKIDADVTISLDEVVFGSGDTWNCTGAAGILRNANAEKGDSRYWTTFNGAIVTTIPGGAQGTKTAIAASNRQMAKSGVGQFLDSNCVQLDQLYQVSAFVKLLNSSNGVPMDCFPEQTYGPNTCPFASIMSQSSGGLQSLHPVASVYNGTWKSGGQWNEIRGYFTFYRSEKDAPTKMFVFERAGPGLTLVIDEVYVAPATLGSTASSPQV